MRDLQALPKAHLHLHLEGSARPATVAELARREGIELSNLTAFATLPEFIECYVLAAIARTSVRVSGAPPGLQDDITGAIDAWEAA
jgi:adenosine deaminase